MATDLDELLTRIRSLKASCTPEHSSRRTIRGIIAPIPFKTEDFLSKILDILPQAQFQLIKNQLGAAKTYQDAIKILVDSKVVDSNVRIVAAMENNIAFPKDISSADLLTKDPNHWHLLFLVAFHEEARLPELLALLASDDERHKALMSTCRPGQEQLNDGTWTANFQVLKRYLHYIPEEELPSSWKALLSELPESQRAALCEHDKNESGRGIIIKTGVFHSIVCHYPEQAIDLLSLIPEKQRLRLLRQPHSTSPEHSDESAPPPIYTIPALWSISGPNDHTDTLEKILKLLPPKDKLAALLLKNSDGHAIYDTNFSSHSTAQCLSILSTLTPKEQVSLLQKKIVTQGGMPACFLLSSKEDFSGEHLRAILELLPEAQRVPFVMKKYHYYPDQFDRTTSLNLSLLDRLKQNPNAHKRCMPVITDLLLHDKWAALSANIADLRLKAQKNPSAYNHALETATNLLNQLRSYETVYKKNGDLNTFTRDCSAAISTAIPALEVHHGFTRACLTLLNTLFALVSNKPLFGTHDNPGFFTKKTNIQKKLAEFEDTLQQINPKGPTKGPATP